MYRKIIFISIKLLQDMDIFSKTMILIFFSFFSFLITFYARPFLLRKMNLLEFYSNLSASLTLFLGAIFISDTNEVIKAISFVNVIVINTFFAYIWVGSMIEILFHTHFHRLETYFPRLAIIILAIKESIENVTFSFNLLKYFRKLRINYRKNKFSLLENADSDSNMSNDKSKINIQFKENRNFIKTLPIKT